jgi:acyl-coenzyme A thioesterase PaaI-like protein
MKAISVGQDILIKASTDKMGSRVAFLSVEILGKSNNELFAKGSHTKFIGNAFSINKS